MSACVRTNSAVAAVEASVGSRANLYAICVRVYVRVYIERPVQSKPVYTRTQASPYVLAAMTCVVRVCEPIERPVQRCVCVCVCV